MSEQVPKIKPLVWEEFFRNVHFANIESKTTFGRFAVNVNPKGAYVSNCPFHVHPIPEFKSEAEAKAWCQAEYERRVRECLE